MTIEGGELFTPEVLKRLFPEDRTNQFFDALLGDAEEGAYDISLVYKGEIEDALNFELQLCERPGRCLSCSLTYGLPEVFTRHPIINIAGLVDEIDRLLAGRAKTTGWSLGRTREVSSSIHVIPLTVTLDRS